MGKAATTAGSSCLPLERSQIFRGSRDFTGAQNQGRHSTDHLEERCRVDDTLKMKMPREGDSRDCIASVGGLGTCSVTVKRKTAIPVVSVAS